MLALLTGNEPVPPRWNTTSIGVFSAWRLIAAGMFLLGAVVWAWAGGGAGGLWLAVAAGVGGYLALNIGANDVANTIGPAVGARVLPLGAALAMAAVCEAGGALIAGGDVVGTIRKDIIDATLIPGSDAYIWAMMSALLAAALWLNLATILGAPVSTTHSIVGGVLGSGVAAAGTGAVHWSVLGGIVASWVVSPVLGAGLAALCLFLIKRCITWRSDVLGAARRGVPFLAAAMTFAFTVYLLLKSFSGTVGFTLAVSGGMLAAGVVWLLMWRHVKRRLPTLRNCKSGVNRLLGAPLILAAGALSFAHGSNDVANAIGPLAGIADALATGRVGASAAVPLWVMVIGALGLATGLVLFGPRLIRTVGREITRLDAIRAYCIAMAATLTVLLASQLGLPVSTTHVTVGAVLGVGLLRERLKARHQAILEEIHANHADDDQAGARRFIAQFHAMPFRERAAMLADLKARNGGGAAKIARKAVQSARRPDLVDRAPVMRIVAAWIVTVPATGGIAALVYFILRGAMLP